MFSFSPKEELQHDTFDKYFNFSHQFFFLSLFLFQKYFPWLPPPSVPPSVLHNIALSACLPSLITGEVEVRMQQSEANRFSFGPGKDFPCQGYTHCCWAHPARAVPLSTPALYCQNIFSTDARYPRSFFTVQQPRLRNSYDGGGCLVSNILARLLTCLAVEGGKGLECSNFFCLSVRSCL